MKGNPQNIEVGDVVSFTSTGESITSVVFSIWNQGYMSIEDELSIDGYRVRATVMNKGTFCNYPVKDLTIVRKWNDTSIAPKEELYKDPSFTVVIKEPDIRDTIAIVSDCIEVIKKRQQEAAKSSLNKDRILPCVCINVTSGEVTFTKFWIDQVIEFIEKYTGETYTFNAKDKTITRFRLMDISGASTMTISEFISSRVNPAIADYLRKDRRYEICRTDYGFWYFA